MKLPFIVCGMLYFCCLVQNLNAQCCAAGNPTTTFVNTGACNENSLAVSIFYQHSYSDTYYKGNTLSDFKYIDNSYFDFSSLQLSYGLLSNLNVTADIGFFFDKTQYFDFGKDAKFNRTAKGIGDASIGTNYIFYIDESGSYSLIPSLKVTLPIGQFDQKDGAVVLPIDIQPSSGSFKYEVALNLAKRINTDFSILSANSLELSQKIETDRTNYKYGNLYNASIFGIYKFIEDISGILQFRAQYREKSIDKGIQLSSTGGFVLFVTPQVSYSVINDLIINLQYEIPVYKNMNGIQLTNNYALGLRISKSIGFGNAFSFGSNNLSTDKTLNYKEISVNGLCDMCKERIESVANEFENIEFADWNPETKILKIGNEKVPDFDGMKKAIAKAGHDNESYLASDEDYNRLHSCCKYRK